MNAKPYVLSASALVWDLEGRLLLLRRAPRSRHSAGEWEPPGGRADQGEAVGESVLREVREETGLEIELDGVAGATEFELPDLRVAVLYFHARVVAGRPQISAEHSEFRWVEPAALGSLQLAEAFRRFNARTGAFTRRTADS